MCRFKPQKEQSKYAKEYEAEIEKHRLLPCPQTEIYGDNARIRWIVQRGDVIALVESKHQHLKLIARYGGAARVGNELQNSPLAAPGPDIDPNHHRIRTFALICQVQQESCLVNTTGQADEGQDKARNNAPKR